MEERERDRMRKMHSTLANPNQAPEPSGGNGGGGRGTYDDGSVQHIGLGKHAGLGAAQMIQVRPSSLTASPPATYDDGSVQHIGLGKS